MGTPPPFSTARAVMLRRWLFGLAVGSTVAILVATMVKALSPGGFDWIDAAMLACFAITLPWSAIGFWNALAGFAVMRGARDPAAAVAPSLTRDEANAPITLRTAILACIRNEDPALIERNLEAIADGLIATGAAPQFHLYILSDTNRSDLAEAEEVLAARLTERLAGALPVTYRRRTENPGFKAGNIRDFLDRWGADHDLAVTLDADSVMSPQAILRLVRIMQAQPGIGILQNLIVGLPSDSAFARIFQFGMRLGMRSYTIGSAAWQADCGPYWGHNAVLRLAPFITHCRLPMLPGSPPLGGYILSHDQVEAAMMRRAGWQVRVVPEEDGSWEENPPTLLEFIRRDLRWCQGNMQYWSLLTLPGLRAVSRFQLVLAILMFLGSPAWLGFVALGLGRALLADIPQPVFDPELGRVLVITILTMTFAPKLSSVIDVLIVARKRQAFGGAVRFSTSVVIETVFSMLLAPIMAVAHTVFLAGLPFGRTIGWTQQQRSGHVVSFAAAFARLWPQTLVGILAAIGFTAVSTTVVLVSLPFVAGLILAIPFTMLTAHPAIGLTLARIGIGRIPEEVTPPPILDRLALPAITAAQPFQSADVAVDRAAP